MLEKAIEKIQTEMDQNTVVKNLPGELHLEHRHTGTIKVLQLGKAG